MARYGRFECFGECLWYGSTAADARSMVLDLIVDDGVPSRGRPDLGGKEFQRSVPANIAIKPWFCKLALWGVYRGLLGG